MPPPDLSTRVVVSTSVAANTARPHQKIVPAATMNTRRAMTTHAPASRARRLAIEAKRGAFAHSGVLRCSESSDPLSMKTLKLAILIQEPANDVEFGIAILLQEL